MIMTPLTPVMIIVMMIVGMTTRRLAQGLRFGVASTSVQ